MRIDEIKNISSLTPQQKKTAEKLFKSVYYHAHPEVSTVTSQAKAKEWLDEMAKKSQLNAERKAKYDEKYGTLDSIIKRVKELVKGKAYTYKDLLTIINEATEQREKEVEEWKANYAKIKADMERLGINEKEYKMS